MKTAVTILACLALALATFSQAAETRSSQAEVLALENAWVQAELHHNAVALGRLMSDDLVITEPDGSLIDKAEEVAFTANPDAHLEILETQDMKVQTHGDVAVVTGAYHEKGSFHGKPFEHRGRLTDTWIRHDRSWQCIASHFSVSVAD